MTATLLPPAWFDSIRRWASLLIPALFAARIASDHRPRLEGKAEGEVTAGARPRITTAMIMVFIAVIAENLANPGVGKGANPRHSAGV